MNGRDVLLRKTNIELLRILSMFMIVFAHVTWEGKFVFSKSDVIHNTMIQFPWLFGQIGVICFTLISSYFLSKAERVKRKSLMKIGKVTWFWSLLILVTVKCFGDKLLTLNIKLYIDSIFPIIMGTYWYVTAYIALYIIFPYLNIIIEKLNRKEYNIFIIVLLIIFSIIPTFTGATALNSTNAASSIFSLIIIYFIGGYIRKYSDVLNISLYKIVIFFITSLVISIIILILLNVANKYNFIDITGTNRLYGRFMRTNSIFQILSGTSLFVIFKKIDIKYNKYINDMANKMFGIYVIHTNPIIIIILWSQIVRINRFESSSYVLMYEFVGAVIVFLGCMLLEYIRDSLFRGISRIWSIKFK